MLGWFQRNILRYPNFMIGMTLSLVQASSNAVIWLVPDI